MKKKINKRLMGTATLAIVVTLLLTVAVCYNLYKSQVLDDLCVYTETVGYFLGMKEEGEIADDWINKADVEKKLSGIGQEFDGDHIRVTLIAADGTVLYDTAAKAEGMGNHKSRPEVMQALERGVGTCIRRSDTLDQSTYYCAKYFPVGAVLRVSKDAGSLYRVVEYAAPYVLAVLGLLLCICAIVSHYMAEGIMKPIKLVAQDAENVEKIEVYEEMKPYIDAIKSQHDDVLRNARIRQEFTANVSHELKTPLTAISGYSELVENGMVAEEKEVRRFAGEIHANANRLLTLINDVIRLSELDGDESEEILEEVNLKESAENCVDMLQINAEKHNVSLSFSGEDAKIMANRQMVEEVLYNLCDNAIRYNREKGSVDVMVKTNRDGAVLIVKDTGIGISKEHRERIFERFYRVDKSRSKSTGGTGLGLAIVKHILIKSGATLTLESEVGKGTEITIVFPAVKEEK